MLPPATLAVTAKLPRVPTLVMLVCAAVVSVPTMLVPLKLPPVILPVTFKLVNVPTLVILPCAAVVTVPAVVADVADGTVPVTLAPVILDSPDPMPLMLAPVILPVELNEVNIPTEVILPCAAVVTVPAVVAEVAVVAVPALVAKVALATVPVTLAPVMLDNKLPLPTK